MFRTPTWSSFGKPHGQASPQKNLSHSKQFSQDQLHIELLALFAPDGCWPTTGKVGERVVIKFQDRELSYRARLCLSWSCPVSLETLKFSTNPPCSQPLNCRMVNGHAPKMRGEANGHAPKKMSLMPFLPFLCCFLALLWAILRSQVLTLVVASHVARPTPVKVWRWVNV